MIDPNASETIDGDSTYTITIENMATQIFSDGSNLLRSSDTVGLSVDVQTLSIPISDHDYNGISTTLTAGENLVFGNFCYLKSDGKMWKADADASTTTPCVAMAVATITADADGLFLINGFARDDTWTWTVGGRLYTSTTDGAVTQTAPTGVGDEIQIVGIATHADRVLFNPDGYSINPGTSAKIKTGTYTGDGTTAKAITGVGFTPKYLKIWIHPTSSTTNEIFEKLDQDWADFTVKHWIQAGAEHYSYANQINSLDADGFTVDDNGLNDDPNALGIVYDYLALG